MLPMPPPPPAALGVFNEVFPLGMTPNEFYLPFLKAPLLAYQESETQEQRIAWLFRAIADINKIIACHEEACKDIKKRLDKTERELIQIHEEISTERIERIAADENLQNQIDTERAERIAADNQLQANIDAEAAAREAADTALGQRIDTERAERIAADEQLQANIDAEAAAREAADTALGQRIDTERAERIAADNQLQANIDAEAAAREAADEQLQANIDAIVTGSDFATQSELDTERAERIAADNQLQANIDAEAAAREAADEQLQANIDALETAESFVKKRIDSVANFDATGLSVSSGEVCLVRSLMQNFDFTDAPAHITEADLDEYLIDKGIICDIVVSFQLVRKAPTNNQLSKITTVFLSNVDNGAMEIIDVQDVNVGPSVGDTTTVVMRGMTFFPVIKLQESKKYGFCVDTDGEWNGLYIVRIEKELQSSDIAADFQNFKVISAKFDMVKMNSDSMKE